MIASSTLLAELRLKAVPLKGPSFALGINLVTYSRGLPSGRRHKMLISWSLTDRRTQYVPPNPDLRGSGNFSGIVFLVTY